MPKTFKLTGTKEMENVLRQLPAQISQKIVISALKKSAAPILEEARRLAPVGDESKGRMRLRRNKSGKTVVSDYGKLKTNLKITNITKHRLHSATVAVTVGKAFWGMFLEFGTRNQKKTPFMRPAFESKKTESLNMLAKNLRLEIEKAAKRMSKRLGGST